MIKYQIQGDIHGLNEDLINRLKFCAEKANRNLQITSGLRSFDKNQAVGGVENSAHLKGLAADIACNNSTERLILIKACIDAGFKRIGIAKNHIHIDIDELKPWAVLFLE